MVQGALATASRAIPSGEVFESTTHEKVFFLSGVIEIKVQQNCRENQNSRGSHVFSFGLK